MAVRREAAEVKPAITGIEMNSRKKPVRKIILPVVSMWSQCCGSDSTYHPDAAPDPYPDPSFQIKT
jgi:hypothetical protein